MRIAKKNINLQRDFDESALCSYYYLRILFEVKKLTTLLSCLLCVCCSYGQSRVSWGVTAMTEGNWNMSDGKTAWVNYLEADLNVALWKGAQFEGAAIATYAAGKLVENSLLGYSNIYTDENKPFRLIQASIGQRIGSLLYLSVGLRNIDIDYFTTPSTSFFTAPADADFPIISSNYPVATFPMSAIGGHLEVYPFEGFVAKVSVYNGVAHETFDTQFHFRPSAEGLFSIGSLSYEYKTKGEHSANYTLGYVYGKIPGEGAEASFDRKTGLWGLVEQPFLHWRGTQWCLLLQGAVMTRHTSGTHGYWGAGLTVNGISNRKMMAGFAVNRMHDHLEGNEVGMEHTWLVPLNNWLSIQPTLHFIYSHHRKDVVGLLRLSVSLGNL